MEPSLLSMFLPAIQQLPFGRPLTRDQLITRDFLISKNGDLEIYFAPHNEYINNVAKIVIVGITPGWSQMRIAFETFMKELTAEKKLDQNFGRNQGNGQFCRRDEEKFNKHAGSMRLTGCPWHR
ncbi:hypothetical protein [Cytobacillus firmus]